MRFLHPRLAMRILLALTSKSGNRHGYEYIIKRINHLLAISYLSEWTNLLSKPKPKQPADHCTTCNCKAILLYATEQKKLPAIRKKILKATS